MYLVILLFSLLFPFIFIPGYYNYTIYKFVFLNSFILIIWLYIGYKIIRNKNPFKTQKISTAEIYLLIYIILILISTVLSIDINKSLIGENRRNEGLATLISYITLFVVTYRFIATDKIKTFFMAFTMLAALISIYGILQHFHLDPLPRITSSKYTTRSYGFFGNPDFFGSFLTLMLPFSMTLFINAKNRLKQLFYISTSSLIYLALLYSQTRSGWVGSFVGFLTMTVFIIIKNKHYWFKWIILSTTFIIILLGVNYKSEQVITNRIDTTIKEIQTNPERGGAGRILIWKNSLPLLSEYFWHGSGPDTFIDAYPNTDDNRKLMGGAYIDKAHNEYLQIAITIGVPALIIYLIFTLNIFYKTITVHSHINKDEITFAFSLLSSFLGYLAQAFFNISVLSVAPYFWISIGLLYGLVSKVRQDISSSQ